MKRAILLLLLISAPVGAQTMSVSGLETANYKFVDVVIENLSADARSIGLTRDHIQTRVELRLRSAGLTPRNELRKKTILYVRITVVRDAYSVAVEYNRRVDFTTGNRRYRHNAAVTWFSGSTGTHGDNAAFIMNSLDGLLDEFLNAYLKVNQK